MQIECFIVGYQLGLQAYLLHCRRIRAHLEGWWMLKQRNDAERTLCAAEIRRNRASARALHKAAAFRKAYFDAAVPRPSLAARRARNVPKWFPWR